MSNVWELLQRPRFSFNLKALSLKKMTIVQTIPVVILCQVASLMVVFGFILMMLRESSSSIELVFNSSMVVAAIELSQNMSEGDGDLRKSLMDID